MRIALRAPNWLGDAVMALPAMAAFRRAFSGDDLTIVGLPSVLTIFAEEHDAQPASLLPLARGTGKQAAGSIAAGRFDRIVLFTNSFGSAWVARRAGVRERWGYGGRGRRLLLTRAAAPPRKDERAHHADFYRTMARRFDATDGVDAFPRLRATPATRDVAAGVLAKAGVAPETPIVVFAPGAAYGHAKRWRPERVAEVAAHFSRERGAVPVLAGAPDDRDTGRAIESWLGTHAPDTLAGPRKLVNLIGRTDVRGLIGLLSLARVVVANDSGAAHLAAALDVPTVTIFGPTNERVSAPIGPGLALSHDVFCRPCMLRDCPIDHRCMKRIPASLVIERAGELYEKR